MNSTWLNSRFPALIVLFVALASAYSIGADRADLAAPAAPDPRPAGRFLMALSDDQMYWAESNCCGLVAAYMVARDLNAPAELEELGAQIPVTASGSTMLDMKVALEKLDLKVTGTRMDHGQLYSLLANHPRIRAIAQVQPEHWIAVFGVADQRLDVFYYPKRKLIASELIKDSLRGPVLLVGRDVDIQAAVAGPNRFAGIRDVFLAALLCGQILLAANVAIRRRSLRLEAVNAP